MHTSAHTHHLPTTTLMHQTSLPITLLPLFLPTQMLELCKLEAPFLPALSAENPTLDVSNFDQKYTLEAPVLSPLRRPLSAEAEGQFEALSLAYISPETRDSMRHSLQSIASSVRPSGTRDSRLSTQSRDSTSSNDSRR